MFHRHLRKTLDSFPEWKDDSFLVGPDFNRMDSCKSKNPRKKCRPIEYLQKVAAL